MLSILLAILMQTPPAPPLPYGGEPETRKFIIYHDDGPDSRLLVSELSRDWTSGKERPPIAARDFAGLQAELRKSIILTHRSKAGREFERIYDYPQFSFGDRGQLRKFDRRAFTASGTALLTLQVIIENESIDLGEWRSDNEWKVDAAESRWLFNATMHLKATAPITYANLRAENDLREITVNFTEFRRRYGHLPGMPEYIEPTLPPPPFKKMPWEVGWISPFRLESPRPAPLPPSEP